MFKRTLKPRRNVVSQSAESRQKRPINNNKLATSFDRIITFSNIPNTFHPGTKTPLPKTPPELRVHRVHGKDQVTYSYNV